MLNFTLRAIQNNGIDFLRKDKGLSYLLNQSWPQAAVMMK
jgi:hypothetical protein